MVPCHQDGEIYRACSDSVTSAFQIVLETSWESGINEAAVLENCED
jgi:hypothetical protein